MIDAATWSAIAASFAALSSFLLMLIHWQNLLEAVHPELVLIGWAHTVEGEGDTAYERITFQEIKNVGKGAAFNVLSKIPDKISDPPSSVLITEHLPILAAGETADLNGQIIMSWTNVPPDKWGLKVLTIRIALLCFDSRGMRHETLYNLHVMPLSQKRFFAVGEIAPAVALSSRTTSTRPVSWLNLLAKLGRIPVLGKHFTRF
jgi:hypothetical protein